MRVLADHHHGVLWEALAMLFVDRAILGPAELVAYVDGYYVDEPGELVDDFPPRGVVAVSDADLAEHPPRIVISTAMRTRERLRDLARKHGALFVTQAGNEWDEPAAPGDAYLRSMSGGGGMLWHPEFHRLPWTPPAGDQVASFHHSFPEMPCSKLWGELATPAWRMFGTEGSPLFPHEVAQARRDSIAAWVCKGADGYGFAVHEAFASGRAVIGHAEHYEGKLAGHLFMSGAYIEPEADAIRAALADPEPWGLRAMVRFGQVVDFDAEAAAIADYLGARL